jgi:spoIIIJ-associated protein
VALAFDPHRGLRFDDVTSAQRNIEYMEDLALAAEKIASLMRLLTTTGGLRLKFRITAGAGAADPDGFERRDIYVECKGPDADLLTDRDGEVLRALEHIAAKVLTLESEEHDRVSFDANGFKAERAETIKEAAEDAVDAVEDTGEPYRFAPMSSRERRMLHMFLLDSGLKTASSGEGPGRHVVLYPEGYRIPEERPRFGRGNDRGRGGDRGRGPRRDGGGRGRY